MLKEIAAFLFGWVVFIGGAIAFVSVHPAVGAFVMCVAIGLWVWMAADAVRAAIEREQSRDKDISPGEDNVRT